MTDAPAVVETVAVMVVDDDPAVLRTLANMLKADRVEVIAVGSSPMALEVARSRPDISVVVSDINMPGLDGLELAALLKEGRAETEAFEIVIITGQPTTANAVGALRRHVFDFLSKPIRSGMIADAARRAHEAAVVRRARACRMEALDRDMQNAEKERHRLHDLLRVSCQQLDGALRETDRVRREVLAVVSHELRTPLIPILGLSDIIASMPRLEPDAVRSYAREINGAGQNLLHLVEGVLEILEWDAGDPGLRLETVDLATLVEQSVAVLAATNRDQQHARIHRSGPSGVTLSADARRLARAISALIENALNASPDGETVEIEWTRPSHGNLELCVRDRGAGIPDRIVQGLGLPLLQADMSQTRAWPGLGMGLAIASRVIGGHGGQLALRLRDPGPGTLAIVSLPIGRA